MKALTKKQRESILARIDNYLMRIPREMSGCVISEGEYYFDLTISDDPDYIYNQHKGKLCACCNHQHNEVVIVCKNCYESLMVR